MAVWGYDQAATLAAMPLYRPEPVVPPSWSAWSLVTAVPRGIGEAAHQVVGSTADLAKAYRFFRDATPQQLRAGVPVEQYSSDFGDYVRDRGRELRPDPASASAAEQVLYGFARGAAKIVGSAVVAGPAGVVAAGLEEGMTQSDELRRQGVGVEARTRAGVVQGAGLALAALPAFGATWGQTAALYVAGGPGGYVAQQAMTREILRTAGHERVAEQFDPLDPVGLAVASLLPAGFAWWGMRGQKLAAAAQSLPDLPRADAGAPAPDAAPFPSEPTAIARAVKLYPDEVVDAARVAYQAEVRSASDPGAGGMRTADAHEAALSRAEDQIARGDAVSVADVAPQITPEARAANFRAWFGDSKVVDESGAPLVVYHGTGADFDAFDFSGNVRQMDAGKLGRGGYFSQSPLWASNYAGQAAIRSDNGAAAVVPVYLSMRNPLVLDGPGAVWDKLQAISDEWGIGQRVAFPDDGMRPNPEWSQAFALEAQRRGFDGVQLPVTKGSTEYVVFRPEQIKSAIGNSGRFDPSSPSLTDPLPAFARALSESVEALRKAEGVEAPKPAAPITFDDLEQQQPARPPSEPPPAAAIADDLRILAAGAGWAQRGGRILRDPSTAIDPTSPTAIYEGDVVGRTSWIPASEWFGRMRSDLGRAGLSDETKIRAAVEKAVNGEPLNAREARTVDWMRREVQDMRDAMWRMDDADELASDAFAEGLGARDAPDVELTARAAEIDADAVERAAMQYENDDTGFMAEMRRIIRGNEEPAAAGQGADARAGAGEGGAQARTTPAATAAQLDDFFVRTKLHQPAAAPDVDAVSPARVAEVAAQFPDLMVRTDDMDAPMRLADFLEAAKAEADEFAADADLMKIAAECALTTGMG